MTAQPSTITVRRDLMAKEHADAQELRERLARRGTLVVNLVSSPGAGKTTLLEATAREFGDSMRLATLVGDLETDRDARRLQHWMPTVQLTTAGSCHLELPLVQRGLEALGDVACDILFIENVGNLVCPASFDLGEHLRVVVLSTTEGDDKPGKYPKMFRTSHAMVVSKSDLLPHVPFSVSNVEDDARRIQPDLKVSSVCALSGDGVKEWCEFLRFQRDRMIFVPSVTDQSDT